MLFCDVFPFTFQCRVLLHPGILFLLLPVGSRAFRANGLRLRGHSAFPSAGRLSNAMGPRFPHLKTGDKNTRVLLLDGLNEKCVSHA